jgi:hypothetical protein
MTISSPINFEHTLHVHLNNLTGEFIVKNKKIYFVFIVLFIYFILISFLIALFRKKTINYFIMI